MKLISKISVIAAAALLVGCATGRSPVSPGFIVTAVSGSTAVGTATSGSKRGSSCATNVLGLFAFGDASTNAAIKKGGITNVQSVDYSTNGVLMLYATSCTVVYGE